MTAPWCAPLAISSGNWLSTAFPIRSDVKNPSMDFFQPQPDLLSACFCQRHEEVVFRLIVRMIDMDFPFLTWRFSARARS